MGATSGVSAFPSTFRGYSEQPHLHHCNVIHRHKIGSLDIVDIVVKGIVKVSIITVHVKNTYGVVEEWFHSFSNCSVNGGEWLA